MKCPYCDKEMKHGVIESPHEINWKPKKSKLFGAAEFHDGADQDRLKLFPSKQKYKILSLIDKWLLRRELIDRGFLERLTDGSKYWMREVQPTLSDFGLELS